MITREHLVHWRNFIFRILSTRSRNPAIFRTTRTCWTAQSHGVDRSIESTLPAGKIVRLTTAGHLMDSRFIAEMLTGFSTTVRGLNNMGVMSSEHQNSQSNEHQPGKSKSRQKHLDKKYKKLPFEDSSLEGQIP